MTKKKQTTAAFLMVYAPTVITHLLKKKLEFDVTYYEEFVQFTVHGKSSTIEAFDFQINSLIAYQALMKKS